MTAACPYPVVAVDPAVLAPLEARAARLPPPSDEGLRVVSYNVLWGVSADSAAKKGGAKPSQAKPTAAPPLVRAAAELPVSIYGRAYREHIIGHELLGYHADLVCVQEMTEAPFQLLAARLAPHGLRAEYGHPAERSGATLASRAGATRRRCAARTRTMSMSNWTLHRCTSGYHSMTSPRCPLRWGEFWRPWISAVQPGVIIPKEEVKNQDPRSQVEYRCDRLEQGVPGGHFAAHDVSTRNHGETTVA